MQDQSFGTFHSSTLREHLLESGALSKDQLEIILREQKHSNKSFSALLIDFGFVTPQTLSALLSNWSGHQQLDLKKMVLDPDLLHQVPQEIAEKYKVIPVYLNTSELHVAMADPLNVLALDQIKGFFSSHLQLIPFIAEESDIVTIIDSYYGHRHSIEELFKDLEESSSLHQEAVISPTIRLVNAILLDAVKARASDIHFEPEASFVRLRYRLDGVMRQILAFHKDYWPSICVRLKIMAEINIAESRLPQDGRFYLRAGLREIDFRVASHPTIEGENIVIRILDREKALVPLENLGFTQDQVFLLKKMLKKPEGLIIVTGPTGSGKSTTVYALLGTINSLSLNIMTLEEPVEYKLPVIRQSAVSTNFNFSDGIRSILRQDPDVIFIGEIRDAETAQMALRASMTGHQVYTTLHTNDVFGVINRLNDLGVSPSFLKGNIIGIIAQRLLRKLCLECRCPYEFSPSEMPFLKLSKKMTLYKAKGCTSCHQTGYSGRLAIAEILYLDASLNISLSSQSSLREDAYKSGFVPLLERGIKQVLSGTTSLEELIRIIDIPLNTALHDTNL